MPSLFPLPGFRAFVAVITLVILGQTVSAGLARGEVLISGGPEAVKIEANEASAEELLAELKEVYGLQYRSSADLGRTLSGTFEGPLRDVVSRVLTLDGYDFGIETSDHDIAVAVYGKESRHQMSIHPASVPNPRPAAGQFPGARPGRPPIPGQAHGRPDPMARMKAFQQGRASRTPIRD